MKTKIEAEIALIKKRGKPINVHLCKKDEAYVGMLPFEIKGEYFLTTSSPSTKDQLVQVEYDDGEVSMEVQSQEETINAFLYKDDSSLLKALMQNLKTDKLTHKPAFIIGPPGTGKTKVISQIIKEARVENKKILIASPTNMAVENVFERLENLEDAVLTIKTADERLREYAPKSIKAKKTAPLQDELEILQDAKKGFEKTLRDAQPFVAAANEKVLAISTKITNIKSDLFALEGKYKKCLQSIESKKKRLISLQNNSMLQRVANIFTSEKIEDIKADLNKNKKASLKLEEQIEKLQSDLEDLQNKETQEAHEKKSCIKKYNEARKALVEVDARIKELQEELEEIKNENIFSKAGIVGATLVNAALNRRIQEAEFDMIIVDEASMALIPFLVATSQALNDSKMAIAYNNKSDFYEAQNNAIAMALKSKMVLVGDPKQLSPIAQTKEMRKTIFEEYETQEIFNGKKVENTVFLDTNFRNHPNIVKLVSNLFYGGLLKSGKPSSDVESIYIRRSTSRMVSSLGSYVNNGNANIIKEQVSRALERGRRSIGVITPFKQQALLVEEILSPLKEKYSDADIQTGTIHTFQGKEKEIIIYDITYSPQGGTVPHAYNGDINSQTAKMLNVATTRAEEFFIVVGDVEGIINSLDSSLVLRQWVSKIKDIN
jgi:superfamily I DNA and/or RNA helicase